MPSGQFEYRVMKNHIERELYKHCTLIKSIAEFDIIRVIAHGVL